MRHPPQRAKPTVVLEWEDGQVHPRLDELAGEEPLQIRIGAVPVSVTMRTPGDDFELAAGFLFTEGIIRGRDDVRRIVYGVDEAGETSGNVVDVILRTGHTFDPASLDRHFVTTSSCGVCGKTSIEAVRARGMPSLNPAFRLDAERLPPLPDALRRAQVVFGRTGGLHAAALFDREGSIAAIREDIGRHNAVDKVIGAALLEGRIPLSDDVLVVSGRGGFEIVQKAVMAGIPVLASVSAPSSLAVQLARESGLTLVGFLRGRRFVVYAGEQRIVTSEHAPATR